MRTVISDLVFLEQLIWSYIFGKLDLAAVVEQCEIIMVKCDVSALQCVGVTSQQLGMNNKW